MTPPMTCAEAEPLLPLVADGAVDPSSDPDLFAHLASCPMCQRAVAEHDLITLALERGAVRSPRRARILTLPRLAAAAVLAGAIGVTAWTMLAPHHGHEAASAPVASQAPAILPVPVVTASVAVIPADPPTVLRIQRTDGSTLFLVKRGEAWVPVDPDRFDGSDAHTPGSGEDRPVRW